MTRTPEPRGSSPVGGGAGRWWNRGRRRWRQAAGSEAGREQIAPPHDSLPQEELEEEQQPQALSGPSGAFSASAPQGAMTGFTSSASRGDQTFTNPGPPPAASTGANTAVPASLIASSMASGSSIASATASGSSPQLPPFRPSHLLSRLQRSAALRLLLAGSATLVGLVGRWPALALVAGGLLLALALQQLLPELWRLVSTRLDEGPTARLLAVLGLVLGLVALPWALGWWDPYLELYRQRNWEAIGALGEGVIGAIGQILVALVALAIAWRQVLLDQRLTGQQNRITQAQTIDSFIQGISDLISDQEGMLEDWPLERMLAEGRLAAVFGSIDKDGRARILRFLSHARLLTPLRRDNRLGRAILDGNGNYEEDRLTGVPVIQLHLILKGVDLSGTDLRGVDFNCADLSGADLSHSDLSGALLAGCNLAGANLERARLEGALLFFGRSQTASPRAADGRRDLVTGRGAGAVVENANFSGVEGLDASSHYYLAAWSGPRSRATLPGGAKGVASQLEPRPARRQPAAGA